MADVLTNIEIENLLQKLDEISDEKSNFITKILVLIIKNDLNRENFNWDNLKKEIIEKFDFYNKLNDEELLKKLKIFID